MNLNRVFYQCLILKKKRLHRSWPWWGEFKHIKTHIQNSILLVKNSNVWQTYHIYGSLRSAGQNIFIIILNVKNSSFKNAAWIILKRCTWQFSKYKIESIVIQMWIFLMLILSITTGTVLTLEQRSDKVYQKWDLAHRVPWTTPCWPWHSTAPQTNKHASSNRFLLHETNKTTCKICDLNVWFFSPKTQPFTDFRQTFNSERNQEPGLELQDGCAHRF